VDVDADVDVEAVRIKGGGGGKGGWSVFWVKVVRNEMVGLGLRGRLCALCAVVFVWVGLVWVGMR
jgi:hypothetical protein